MATHHDVRDSVFSVIRGLTPTTEEAMAGLLNVLGAVIAERAKGDVIEQGRLIGIVESQLPRYVHAYRTNNPLRR